MLLSADPSFPRSQRLSFTHLLARFKYAKQTLSIIPTRIQIRVPILASFNFENHSRISLYAPLRLDFPPHSSNHMMHGHPLTPLASVKAHDPAIRCSSHSALGLPPGFHRASIGLPRGARPVPPLLLLLSCWRPADSMCW